MSSLSPGLIGALEPLAVGGIEPRSPGLGPLEAAARERERKERAAKAQEAVQLGQVGVLPEDPAQPAEAPLSPEIEEEDATEAAVSSALKTAASGGLGAMLDDPEIISGIEKAFKQSLTGQAELMAGLPGGAAARLMANTSKRVVEATNQMAEDIQTFMDTHMERRRAAEADAARKLEEAQTELRFGRSIDDVQGLQNIIEQGAEPGATPAMQALARRAAERLEQWEQTGAEPDPNRLWNDAGAGKQAAFIVLNMLGQIGQVLSGRGGPTPLDILDQMMERDYQAQKEAFGRRRERVREARSAYDLATRITDNELQRRLITKDLMLAPLQAQAQAAGQLGSAEQLRFHREATKAQLAQSELQQRVSTALKLLTDRQKAAAKGLGLGATARKEIASAKASIDALNRLEAEFGRLGWEAIVTQYAPWSDAADFNARRAALISLAATEAVRMSDQDRKWFERAIPSAGTTRWVAESLFAERKQQLMDKINRIVEAETGGVGAAPMGAAAPQELPGEQPLEQ